MIPIIVGAGALVLATLRVRPSTLLRVGEDGAVGGAKLVAKVPRAAYRKAKGLGRELGVEYKARQIDKLQRAVSVEAAKLRALSDEQRAALASDEAAIFRRVEELRAKREARRAKK